MQSANSTYEYVPLSDGPGIGRSGSESHGRNFDRVNAFAVGKANRYPAARKGFLEGRVGCMCAAVASRPRHVFLSRSSHSAQSPVSVRTWHMRRHFLHQLR